MAHTSWARSIPRLRSSATSLIRKGRSIGHTGKVGEMRRDDLFLLVARATLNRAKRHYLDLGPYASH